MTVDMLLWFVLGSMVIGALIGFHRNGRTGIPLGLLLGAFGAFGWIAIVLLTPPRLNQRPGTCWSCGYDLTEDTTGKCPECGSECGRR